MGPTWGPSGADRTQVGPMLAPWTLLSGRCWLKRVIHVYIQFSLVFNNSVSVSKYDGNIIVSWQHFIIVWQLKNIMTQQKYSHFVMWQHAILLIKENFKRCMLMSIVFILVSDINQVILFLVDKNMIVGRCHVMTVIKDNLNSELSVWQMKPCNLLLRWCNLDVILKLS